MGLPASLSLNLWWRDGEDSETLFSGLAHLKNLGSDDEEAIDYSYKAEASKKPIRALAHLIEK